MLLSCLEICIFSATENNFVRLLENNQCLKNIIEVSCERSMKIKISAFIGMVREESKPEFYVTKYCDKPGKGHWKYESRNDLLMTDFTLEELVCFYLHVKICVCR